MRCQDCGSTTVAFEIPAPLREYAPVDGARAAFCPTCLRVHPADEGDGSAVDADVDPDPDFSPAGDFFPDGEAGVAMALALGQLDRLALNRGSIVELCSHVERAGADPLLTLDRLASAPGVTPHFDVERRRRQLAGFLS